MAYFDIGNEKILQAEKKFARLSKSATRIRPVHERRRRRLFEQRENELWISILLRWRET
jgi:hypothetical protein